MSKILNTRLLGREFASASVPYRNITGRLYAEDGCLVFYSYSFFSDERAIWSVPLEHIVGYGSDWGRWGDIGHTLLLLILFILSCGFIGLVIPVNRYSYVWVKYYDEQLGHNTEAWFLVYDALLNDAKAQRIARQIGEELGIHRGEMRSLTTPR